MPGAILPILGLFLSVAIGMLMMPKMPKAPDPAEAPDVPMPAALPPLPPLPEPEVEEPIVPQDQVEASAQDAMTKRKRFINDATTIPSGTSLQEEAPTKGIGYKTLLGE